MPATGKISEARSPSVPPSCPVPTLLISPVAPFALYFVVLDVEGTMKKLALVASAATALICAAALVDTPADAKKRVKKPAASPAGQMAYRGSVDPPPRGAGGPIRSGNWCWRHEFGYTTRSQFGYWVPLSTLTSQTASDRCRRAL